MFFYPNEMVPLQIDLAMGDRRTSSVAQPILAPRSASACRTSGLGSGGELGGDGAWSDPVTMPCDLRLVAEGAELRAAGESGAGRGRWNGFSQGAGDDDVVDQSAMATVDPAVLLSGGLE